MLVVVVVVITLTVTGHQFRWREGDGADRLMLLMMIHSGSILASGGGESLQLMMLGGEGERELIENFNQSKLKND